MIEKELVIVGAGPSGLRAGEEAQKHGIDYLIIEQGKVGQAWRDIRMNMPMLSPSHPQRDWTSISEQFPIWKLKITRPYCSAGEFVIYLQKYAEHFKLNLKLQTGVQDIRQTDDGKFILDTPKNSIQAKTVIVSTGFFGNPFIPDINGFANNAFVSHSHYFKSADPYKQKRIAVLGGGNSAAEIAIELSGFSQVFLLTRRPLRFFSKTNNLCDIRGVSESMLLELMRMGLIRNLTDIKIKRLTDNKLYYDGGCLVVDHIICATGYHPCLTVFKTFKPSISPKNKFPRVSSVNEALNIRNLFFAGPLAYKRTGNLFIHGFVKNIPPMIQEVRQRLSA